MNLHTIRPETLRQRLADGTARVVDVREPDEFARSRIAGSELAPLSRFDPAQRTGDDSSDVVLCCRTGRRSAEAAKRILDAGATEVTHLEGGVAAWQAAGLPLTSTQGAPISLMRQVQIVAGSMILLATLLTIWVSPWFLLLCGATGAGLLFAGLTDTCAMARLLDRMPWNRAIGEA